MMSIVDNVELDLVPAKALNFSSRFILSKSLNLEQKLLSSAGYARDYKGLAEQMDFSYDDIKNFQRNDDPTMRILEAWTIQPNATIGKLIEFLENMGRHDIIQDIQPSFEKDARKFTQEVERYNNSPLQVHEVSSCPPQIFTGDDMNILTREDANTGECTLYDAYVSYADEDIQFVFYLAKFLEESGFKLFIRSRDLLAGQNEYETNMQLIKERCKRVLIVLSPDFLKCPACEVQASFAAGLGFVERCRKIVPILLKSCEIPLILKFVSRIDFTKPDVQDWIWEKLKSSLRDAPSSIFISPERRSIQGIGALLPLESSPSPDSGNPCITFPPTTAYSLSSNVSSKAMEVALQYRESDVLQPEVINENSSAATKSAAQSKKNKLQNFRFWQTKKAQKKDAAFSSPSSTSVSTSNATSGFHSQSGNNLGSIDGINDCSQDTSV